LTPIWRWIECSAAIGRGGSLVYADALQQGTCIDGEPRSAFGQVSFCNGINFFNAAFALERAGRLVVPSAGISRKMVATRGCAAPQTASAIRACRIAPPPQSSPGEFISCR